MNKIILSNDQRILFALVLHKLSVVEFADFLRKTNFVILVLFLQWLFLIKLKRFTKATLIHFQEEQERECKDQDSYRYENEEV